MNFFMSDREEMVICDLCFRHCRLEKGEVGFCGVNENREGELFCLVQGAPSALHIDPIEKKPLYHFLPGTKTFSIGTVGCNFRCPFCQNWSLSFSEPNSTEAKREISPKEIIVLAQENSCNSIAFTYNEPTIFWPYGREIAIEAKAAHLKSVMVSNGAMSETVATDIIGKIDALNIDLKTGSKEKYSGTLKGSLKRVLTNIEFFLSHNIWVELTTLVVPDFNDSLKEIEELMLIVKKEFGTHIPWHISAFHPAWNYSDRRATESYKIKEVVTFLKEHNFSFVYSGNIGSENPTLCPNCHNELIHRTYYHTKSTLNSNQCITCNATIPGVFQ